jgi:hypothetical protein
MVSLNPSSITIMGFTGEESAETIESMQNMLWQDLDKRRPAERADRTEEWDKKNYSESRTIRFAPHVAALHNALVPAAKKIATAAAAAKRGSWEADSLWRALSSQQSSWHSAHHRYILQVHDAWEAFWDWGLAEAEQQDIYQKFRAGRDNIADIVGAYNDLVDEDQIIDPMTEIAAEKRREFEAKQQRRIRIASFTTGASSDFA